MNPLGAIGGLVGGGLSTSATSGAGSGDVSAGFLNNAGLTVGGSGRTSASADSGVPSTASNLPVYLAIGIAGVAVLILALRR